ncbi:hypothetical protein BH20VER1_BH20VER1_02370 [soil metagenome]
MTIVPRSAITHTAAAIRAALLVALLLGSSGAATAATVQVVVDRGFYNPFSVTIRPGDTVEWRWVGDRGRTVTSGTPGNPTGLFDSGIRNEPYTFSYTFTEAGRYDYHCRVCPELTGLVEVIGSQPLNISTRLRVQTGENVMIGGFIIGGVAPKKLLIRAIGPSLAQAGLGDVLADPTLELRARGGALLRSNDDWKETQESDIRATGIPPQDDRESAIIITLPVDSYTAIVSGKGGTSGVGLVEIYDLEPGSTGRLANISTRGLVQTENNVMIGGFILGNGTEPTRVIIRALGPSLTQAGISGALSDPTLQLRDSNGGLVRSNNDWKESQQADIEATGIPPQNERESAIIATLAPGAYTAIVTGNANATGVALVEVYHLL